MKRFEILNALPAYGPMPVSISNRNRPFYSEGFVVRFYRSDGSAWIGNFEPGAASLNTAVELPGTGAVIVIAGGTCYLMNADSETPVESFGYRYNMLLEASGGRLVLFDDIELTVIGPDESHWDSVRISLDGIADVSIQAEVVTGLAYDPTPEADEWRPFSYNIDTRELTGGSYGMHDAPGNTDRS